MHNLSILQVEDEPDIREITSIALECHPKMELRSVSSGMEALDLLASGFMPDVILLDVMMPTLDGPTTLARIRALPDHIKTPIIFMTARTQAHEKNRYVALGAVGIITKPFDPMTLGEQVLTIIAGEQGR